MLLMKARSRDVQRTSVRPEPQRENSTNSNGLSKLAILLSLVALGLSGVALYKAWQLQPAVPIATSAPASPVKPEAASSPTSEATSALTSGATSGATTSPATKMPSEPGKLVQLALDNKAEVTLLTAERIQDPDHGTSDVVNVKLRVRRLAENVSAYDFVNVGGATAQETGNAIATYEPVDAVKRSTGPISLQGIRKEASADAYVWLRVPEGVSMLNVQIPGAEPFQAVKIVN